MSRRKAPPPDFSNSLADHSLWERVKKTAVPLQNRNHLFNEFHDMFLTASQWRQALSSEGPKLPLPLSQSSPKADSAIGAAKSLENKQTGEISTEALQRLQQSRLQVMTASAASNGLLQNSSPNPLQLDEKTSRRIKKGHIAIDAVIDLHGLTQAAAHDRLLRFIANAQTMNNRLILVITGKGSGKASSAGNGDGWREQGVLKRLVPHWLEEPAMRLFVSGYSKAHREHGGEGALYVRIRRNRATS